MAASLGPFGPNDGALGAQPKVLKINFFLRKSFQKILRKIVLGIFFKKYFSGTSLGGNIFKDHTLALFNFWTLPLAENLEYKFLLRDASEALIV